MRVVEDEQGHGAWVREKRSPAVCAAIQEKARLRGSMDSKSY